VKEGKREGSQEVLAIWGMKLFNQKPVGGGRVSIGEGTDGLRKRIGLWRNVD